MLSCSASLAYLEYVCQILDNLPLFYRKFKRSHPHVTVGSYFVVSSTIRMRETQHLVRIIPTGFDITRHYATGQRSRMSLLARLCQSFENGKPLW